MRRLIITAIVALALAGAGVAYAAFSATTSNSGNSLAAGSSFKSCNYSATVLATTGLVNYWRLGEASGTSAADSKGTSTGTYVGTPTLGAADAIAGDANKAVSFDGVDDTMDVPDTTALRENGSWTMEFWAKATSFPAANFPGMVRKGDATTANGFIVWYDRTTHKLRYKRNNVSTSLDNTELFTGEFHHYALAYDGTTLKAYVDGTQTDSVAVTWPTNAGTNAFQLGRADFFGNLVIDEFAYYNTAMTAATAQAHFRCGQRYRDAVMDTSGLQSYWRLSEPFGSVAFDSKGTVDGDYVGAPTLGQPGALTAAGDLGPDFDSLNDWVDFGDFYDFTGTAAFTAEAWINRGTGRETGYRWILGKDTTNAPRDGWNINLAANTHIVDFERWSNGTSNTIASTTAIASGTWYHLAATYDGTTMRLYVNGVQQASAASSISQLNTTYPFRIGAVGATGGAKYSGTIDEVAIYNRALSAAEINAHYDAR
jgi:hypothetical protein